MNKGATPSRSLAFAFVFLLLLLGSENKAAVSANDVETTTTTTTTTTEDEVIASGIASEHLKVKQIDIDHQKEDEEHYERILLSTQCSNYLNTMIYANMERLLEYDDDDIVAHACDSGGEDGGKYDQMIKTFEIITSTEQQQPVEPQEEHENGDEGICGSADIRLVLLRDKIILQKALRSRKACIRQVEKELDLIYMNGNEVQQSSDTTTTTTTTASSSFQKQIRFASKVGNLPVMRFTTAAAAAAAAAAATTSTS